MQHMMIYLPDTAARSIETPEVCFNKTHDPSLKFNFFSVLSSSVILISSCQYFSGPLATYFSLSPNHFETKSEEDTEKKVELLASVATAFAK